ncbi:MAG: sugar-binding protein, partial [Candidatus Firestonebacteria bacterium]
MKNWLKLQYLPWTAEIHTIYCPRAEIKKNIRIPGPHYQRIKGMDKDVAARLFYTKDSIYFLFERKVGKEGLRKFGKSPIWQDDTVEIFLDAEHNHRNYFQFIVNPLNKKECNYLTT